MAILCDACGKVITTIYHIHKENMFFCSYKCYKSVTQNNDVDFSTQKKEIGQNLLGINSKTNEKKTFLHQGDASGNSMVQATNFERQGEYKKALNCWKRILILHKDDGEVIERARERIKTLERKLKSKHQGLKEGSKNEIDK